MTDVLSIAWPPLADEPGRVQRWRQEAREQLQRLGLPTTADEHWRRADLRFLAGLASPAAQQPGVQAASPSTSPATPAAASAASESPLLEGSHLLRFVDGRFDVTAGGPAVGDAVTLVRLDAALRAATATRGPLLPNEPLVGDLRLALLNHALGADGVQLLVRRGPRACAPIVIEHRSAQSPAGIGAVSHLVELEPGASATLVEWHDERSTAPRTLLHEVRIVLGEGSRLRHLRLIAPTHAAHLVDTLTVELAAEAEYRQQALFAPARAVRSTQSIRLAGPRAHALLQAGAVARRGADVDLHVLVRHEADATRSEQTVHVLGTQGRATVDSEVQVSAGRQAIRSRQSLRALLLGMPSDVALRPRLGILSDDVDCRHGATTSAISEDQLFFLRSRGLPREEAQRLLAAAHLQQLFPADGPSRPLDELLRQQLDAALASAIPANVEVLS